MLTINKLITISKKYRSELFEKFLLLGQCHPGSTFSIIEILVALYYGNFIRIKKKKFYDKLIISKGHATVGVYPILRDFKILSKKDWNNWGRASGKVNKNNSKLRIFGNIFIPGIEATTGSLGHGVGIGCGLAYSFKQKKINKKVFIIISEGELYEGSTWEAFLFASNYNLSNLVIIIDINSLIILGKTKDCMNLGNIKNKINSFGFETRTCDGHQFNSIFKALKFNLNNKPKCILAKTIKGKGFSLMENKANWHYWNNLTLNEIKKCRSEIK